MAIVSAVGQKAGCLLVQFPASVRIGQLRQLEMLMRVLREKDIEQKWHIALEFRHQNLYTSELFGLLKAYHMDMVLHDKAVLRPW